jgi:hypothetical protein
MPFVQVGITALRAPDGTFLPSTPIYAEVPEVSPEGLTPTENDTIDDIAQIFAEKFKQYINGTKAPLH